MQVNISGNDERNVSIHPAVMLAVQGAGSLLLLGGQADPPVRVTALRSISDQLRSSLANLS